MYIRRRLFGCRTFGTVLLLVMATSGRHALAADLLVSSEETHAVLRYDETGAFVGTFASGNGMNRPEGLAFGDDGRLLLLQGRGRALRVQHECARSSGPRLRTLRSRDHGSTPAFALASGLTLNRNDVSAEPVADPHRQRGCKAVPRREERRPRAHDERASAKALALAELRKPIRD
jgi:hypothetical protein